ncbi:chaperonin 10-like protein [Vararia minispora EC-137]|uniref:Chaperonin 10-like protein n=1 Tax=Vararia minispora EC-137 TaxID=1314806 RepID=A0ACB8QD56_9AGAM|nr:chaperonin 10-like protein [Vararia minispora EC-137]
MSQQKALLFLNKDAKKFTLGTRLIPKPGPGQVLIKNKAVAINPIDAYIEKMPGLLDQLGRGYPALAGVDGAGVIQKLGEGVSGWTVGDEIMYEAHDQPDFCTFQEYSLSFAARIAKIPKNLTFDEATTIPLCFAVAAIGLYDAHAEPGAMSGGMALTAPWEEGGRGKYAGQPILVTGGASSVGQFVIQLAKLSGFDPIITTASAHNVGYCKAAGATHVIDYKETPYDQLHAAISKITSEPFQYAFDSIAITKETQQACYDILAPGGTVGLVQNAVVGKPNDVADDGSGKRTAVVFAWIHAGPHVDFATRMYAVLTGMVERGEVKPNKVELLPGGLVGIMGGLGRFPVSGVKLVAHPPETP